MTFSSHGAVIECDSTTLTLRYSVLAQSLGSPAVRKIAVEDIKDTSFRLPSKAGFGRLVIAVNNTADTVLAFAPGSDPRPVAEAIAAAKKGEIAQVTPTVVGLNFTALDVETANDSWGSVCQVGVVRFRDGKEVDAASWLCTPPPGLEEFLEANMAIHGITPADVAGSPTFAEILPEVLSFLGNDVMVAHNAQFDATALRTAAMASNVTVPQIKTACSLALARDASRAGTLKVNNHRLPTVAKAVGAKKFRHHDATEDARAAGAIITGLARAWGWEGSLTGLFASREFALGEVSPAGVVPVLRQRTAPIAGTSGGAGTDFRDPAAAPGKKKSSGRRPAPWAAVATPTTIPEPNPDADPEGPLCGQHVTLTGDFEPFDKGMLWDAIAQRGGTVGKSVTKKTTILVLGTWATKTSKQKRAEELIAKGQDIALWPREKLFETLDLDFEPPF